MSTDEQVQGGGLEVQERAIREHCRAKRLLLVDVVGDEGTSGSNGLDDRVGLASALARLEAEEADCLLVHRMDRLARDLILQELLVDRLHAHGIAITSVMEPNIDTNTDDPTKILIRQILGAIAQYERAIIRGRMQAGKLVKASRGGYVGGQPGYGRRVDNAELVEDPAEAELVSTVVKLRSDGASYRLICAVLTEAGFEPRRAKRWHPMVVRSIVQQHLPA